jgi:hypothetical protein
MPEHQASRTLLKSPPELWAELSDAESLARHLDDFGDIRITRLEPEQAVAWEGERVSGTVSLAPSGWGTKVTLTARSVARGASEAVREEPLLTPRPVDVAPPHAEPEPPAEPAHAEPEPPAPEPPRVVRVGFMGRLRHLLTGPPAAPNPSPSLTPEPVPVPIAPALPLTPRPGATATPPKPAEADGEPSDEAEAALTAALDSLGKAHHRPFSRG